MAATSHWTKKTAAKALAAKAEELGRTPRTADCVSSTASCPSATVVARLFGSWNEGLVAAGLADGIARHVNAFRNEWTDVEILEAIQSWTVERGEPPTSRDWTRRGAARRTGVSHGLELELEVSRWPLSSLVIRRFGTWSAAIAQAGFPGRRAAGPRNTKQWWRPVILASIAGWVEANGRAPTVEEWKQLPRGSYPAWSTIEKRVGWNAALDALGLRPETETEKLLRQIRENPGITLGDLTDRASVSAGSVRSLVSKLARAGKVRKTREQAVVRLWPT